MRSNPRIANPDARDRSLPKQERARETYDRLLNVAGDLLGEVGIDRITTNLICARAGLTPPALYRYFNDKYAVLEALGTRLMDRQNRVLEDWIARHQGGGVAAMQSAIEELLRATAATTAAEPGAIWILRALRASPQLIHIRVDSHRYVTDRLTDAYAAHLPDVPRAQLWQRLRLSVEMGFALDEMLGEEPGVERDAAFAHAARMLRGDAS